MNNTDNIKTNFNNILKLKDDGYPKARRTQIFIGTKCSYKCVFCFYKDRRNNNNANNVYEQLDAVKKYGIYDLDFTGGEPTEDDNLIDYFRYARDKFRQIAVITNGNRFSDINYMKDCVKSGMNEILFSLHGYDRHSHNKITRINGSFEKLITSIENAKSLGLLIRFNTTLNEYNLDYLDTMHVDLIREFKPICQNYLTLNFWEDNKEFKFTSSYSDISCLLKNSINKIKDIIPYICVRYFPYCYMVGYEKYIVNKYQHVYDYFDWNVELDTLPNIDYNIINSSYGSNSFDKVHIVRDFFYIKKKGCMKCQYRYICDGLLKPVANLQNIYPVESDTYIKDSTHFIKDYHSQQKYETIINKF